MPTTPHTFEHATHWADLGAGRFTGQVPPSWMQGRTAFGGVITAAALRATRACLSETRPPLTVSTRFLRPVLAGPATVQATVLRAGRHVTHGEASVTQNDQLCAIVSTTFGHPRDSKATVPPPSRPDPSGPDNLFEMPFLPGLTPDFTQHFAYRWTHGAPPFTGAETAETAGWCRFRQPPGSAAEAALGLLDAWPAPVLSLLRKHAPASTVNWTAHLIDVPAAPGDGWWWFTAKAVTSGRGYATTQAQLFAPDGRLAAWAEQLVAIFD